MIGAPFVGKTTLSANDRMAGEGMRVLADGQVDWQELTWVGLVGLVDPIRPGVPEAWRRSGNAALASTVAFSTLSTGQLLYALTCRSSERAAFRRLGDNPALMAGFGGMLGLQAATVVVAPLRALLGTAPLGLADLALVGAGATVPQLVREALKTRPDGPRQRGGSPVGARGPGGRPAAGSGSEGVSLTLR